MNSALISNIKATKCSDNSKLCQIIECSDQVLIVVCEKLYFINKNIFNGDTCTYIPTTKQIHETENKSYNNDKEVKKKKQMRYTIISRHYFDNVQERGYNIQ
jgi:hypothetical protein